MKILLFLILGLALGFATKLEYVVIICGSTSLGILYLYTCYYYFQNHKTAIIIISIAISLFFGGYIYCVGRNFYQEYNKIHNMPHDIKVIGYITDLPHYKNNISSILFKVTEGYYVNKTFIIFYDGSKDQTITWQFNRYYKLNLHLSFPPLQNEASSNTNYSHKIDGYARLLTPPVPLKDFWSVLGEINTLRQNMINYLQAIILDNEFKGVIISLVTGYNDYITEEQWKLFSAVGIIHLVNISGLHVTIIYGWMVLIARYLYKYIVLQLWKIQIGKSQPWINQVDFISYFSVFTICLYGLFVGMSVPTQRAVFCVVLLNIFSLCRFYISKIDVLILVCVMVLLWDPGHLFDGGCWISFAIIFVIFYISTKYRYHSKIYRKLLCLVMMSGVVFPLSVWFFGSVAWASLLVNIVAIPVIGDIITPFLLFASICHINSVVEFAGWCLQICLHVLNSLEFLQEKALYCDDITVIVLAYCGFFLLVIPRIVKCQLILGVMLMSSIFFLEPVLGNSEVIFSAQSGKHELIYLIFYQGQGYLLYFSDANLKSKSKIFNLTMKYKIEVLHLLYSNQPNIELWNLITNLGVRVIDHQFSNEREYIIGKYNLKLNKNLNHVMLLLQQGNQPVLAVTDSNMETNQDFMFNKITPALKRLFYVNLDKDCLTPAWLPGSYISVLYFFYFSKDIRCWNRMLDNLSLNDMTMVDGTEKGEYVEILQ